MARFGELRVRAEPFRLALEALGVAPVALRLGLGFGQSRPQLARVAQRLILGERAGTAAGARLRSRAAALGDDLVHGVAQPVEGLVDGDALGDALRGAIL